MGCFSPNVSGQSAQQVPTLTPEQQELVGLLGRQATPAVQAITGATIPGQEFAPGGPSPLQQQAFGLAGQLPEQFQFDPNRIAQQFQPLAEFARQGFQQETIPAIAGAAGFGGGARSSGFQDILAREGRNLELGLASHLGQQQIGAFERAQDRTGQLPGLLAGIGGLQRALPEEQRQFGLQQFRAGAPEADPRLGLLGPAFTSPFDTAVQQGFASPGLGSQLLGAAGGFAAAFCDERYKENIVHIDDALEKIKALDGNTYNYKGNDPRNRDGGIMAQDMEKIKPDAVIEISGKKYVKYDAVVALLINAVNELARKVG